MDTCPFCGKEVTASDPDRVVINNSGTVCHNKCMEEVWKDLGREEE